MTQEEFERQAQQERQQRYAEYMQRQMDEQAQVQGQLVRAQRQAQLVQHEINTRPKRHYAAIVAVDLYGGFSKDGQIPWHFPADFKWFQGKTKGHVCVMGRKTYDDICMRLGEKAADSVLPGRKCYVVTSRPLPRTNATPLTSLNDLDVMLDRANVPYDQTVYFCGGQQIYNESVSKVDTVYMTVINGDYECDKHFPMVALKAFTETAVEKDDGAPELRFVTLKRNG